MPMKTLMMVITFACAMLLVATLYQITLAPEADPCSDQAGISAAAIADEGRDQENLVDRALLNQAGCAAPTEPED